MALSNDYRVYAFDIIGEAGNSEEYRPDIDSDAFVIWMKDVLNVLSIERTVLIGNSYNPIQEIPVFLDEQLQCGLICRFSS